MQRNWIKNMEPRKYNLASNYMSHICSKFKPKFYPINPMLMEVFPSLTKILKMKGAKTTPNYKSKEFRKYNGEKDTN